jgi:hypothetical protein
MLINFTIPGVGGFMSPRVHVGSDNWNFMGHSDDTSELTQDGVIEFTLTDTDFRDWTYGTGTLDIDPSIDENDYYWLRLDCTSDYSTGTVPIIELITLLNQTIKGDVNFALLRESGYQYDDTWGPTGINQPSEPIGLRVSKDEDNDLFGTLEYDSSESFIIKSSDPNIIGFEEGLYKLLIVPENWDYSGSIKIRFTIEDYWGYHVEQSYTIDQNPVAHSWQIGDMVNVGDSILYNYSTYPYDFSITYNDTD